MHGKSKWIGAVIVMIITLLLMQGVVLAAPAIGTTAGQTDPTTSTATASTATAATTVGAGQTDATATGQTTGETTVTTASPAPQREPEVPFRPLVQYNTPWDEQAVWHEDGTTYIHTQAAWRTGRADGKALLFNGASHYMQVNMEGVSAPFTLSMWINRSEQGAASANLDQRLFTLTGKDGQNEIYLSPAVRRTDAQDTVLAHGMMLSVGYKTKKTEGKQELYYPATETVKNELPTGSWHHIALTVEEQKLAVFVDGVLWKETALPISLKEFNLTTLRLGGVLSDHSPFIGLMEDVRLYQGMLSPVQIARLSHDADPFDPTVEAQALTYTPGQPTQEPVFARIFRARSEDGEMRLVATKSAFWEAPQLTAGQSVKGTLTLQNHGRYPARMLLEGLQFPQKGTAGYTYLSRLFITVSAGNRVLYSGPYTELTAEALKIDHDGMAYGAEQNYHISLFCPFDCTVTPEGTVEWDFEVERSEGFAPPPAEKQPILLLALLVLSAAAVAACLIWSAKRKQ